MAALKDAGKVCRYQTTVATLSRRARDIIENAFESSVEGGRESPLVLSVLHDFGMRGCTCVEQSVLGGVAHLLNFSGSDTMSAGYYAQVFIANNLDIFSAQTLFPTAHEMPDWSSSGLLREVIELISSNHNIPIASIT